MSLDGETVFRCLPVATREASDRTEENICQVETGRGRPDPVWDKAVEDEGKDAAWGVAVAWAGTAPGPARPGPASAQAVGTASLTPPGVRAIG